MGVQLFWCCQKQGFFLDEVYSYGLSNGYYTPFMTTIDAGDGFIDKVLSRADLLDYVSVNPGEQFDYGSVYYNQTQDVHPPLFYFLLHTVCSFFPGAFSKWFGLVLNLIVMAATLALLYSLGRKLLKSKWLALAACLLYGISFGGLSTVLMVRMYMLLTLVSTALAWVVAVNFERPKAWHYPLAAAIVFLGMMTQYLFAVYAFFICAVYCGYLLYKRRWRQALSFGGSAVVGLGAMLVAFPSWWAQMHSQSTVSADTALSNFTGGIVFYAKRLAYGIKNVGISLPVVGVLFLISLVLWVRSKDKRGAFAGFPVALAVVGTATVLSCAAIAVVSPYADKRYLSNMLPMLTLLVVGLAHFAARSLSSKTEGRCWALAMAAAVAASLVVAPSFIYPTYKAFDETLSRHQDDACVYLTPDKNPSVTSNVPNLLNMQNVCFVSDPVSEVMDEYIRSENSPSLVVFVAQYPAKQDGESLCRKLAEAYGYDEVDEIEQENTFSTVYVLSREVG